MTSTRPLEGIRVLEIASMIFGPLAGQYLGDMGAEVIKLEPPEGDLTRAIGPRRSPRMGAFFMTSNRSKRSIVVDLKRPEGRAVLQRLLGRTDVLLHSLRTPAADRLGLNYPALAAQNPALVYCHVTGYGDQGPYGGRPAYDDIIQAASGLAMLQKVVGGQPRFIPTIIADKISGVHAAYAIVLALLHRLRSGQGQQVDIAMFETMAAFNMLEHQWGHAFEPPIGPMGYAPVSSAARRPYRTLDGFLALLPYSNTHWKRFFELAGEPQIMQDPRFATFAARQEHFRTVWDEIERQVARLAAVAHCTLHQFHRLHRRVQVVLVRLLDLPYITLVARTAPVVVATVLPPVQDRLVLALVVGTTHGERVLGPDHERRPLATGGAKRRLQRVELR
jgi:crotonobetainyl-CoA:carnitine CoA-transferase CaiB-like acyl-CoA transferase